MYLALGVQHNKVSFYFLTETGPYFLLACERSNATISMQISQFFGTKKRKEEVEEKRDDETKENDKAHSKQILVS